MAFTILLIFPVLIALGFLIFGNKKVTLKEFLVQLAVQVAIAGISAGIIYYANTSDTEIINGTVTNKKQNKVGCRHSYQCNCYTTCSSCGKSECCSTHCSTCYEHSFDYDWDVYMSYGDEIAVDTIDRQGLKEPPRWTAVKIGEPASTTKTYTNYVKAAPDTLFRKVSIEGFSPPTYPKNIYDLYRLNRLVTVGANVPDSNAWNAALSEINARLGPRKQANVVLVLTKDKPQDWFYALEASWIGGKKNDIVVVASVDDALVPQWVSVMAWSKKELVKVTIRDGLMSLSKLTVAETMKVIESNVLEGYERKPMEDFEYLRASIVPSTTEWIVSMLIGLIVSIALGIFMYQTDLFDEEGQEYRRTRNQQFYRRMK
jgi:hypothetical protein